MKITKGKYAGNEIKIVKSFMGKQMLRINSNDFNLDTDVAKLEIINQEKYRSVLVTALVLIFALSLVGIPVALIIWMIASKRVDTNLYIEFNDGFPLYVVADTKEWSVLKDYVTVAGQKAAI